MDNYYADAGGESEPQAKPEEASDSQTAELPKEILGGQDLKAGDEVTLKIVQVNEDSVLVKYASQEPEEPTEPMPEEAPPPAAAPGGMGAMME